MTDTINGMELGEIRAVVVGGNMIMSSGKMIMGIDVNKYRTATSPETIVALLDALEDARRGRDVWKAEFNRRMRDRVVEQEREQDVQHNLRAEIERLDKIKDGLEENSRFERARVKELEEAMEFVVATAHGNRHGLTTDEVLDAQLMAAQQCEKALGDEVMSRLADKYGWPVATPDDKEGE